MTNVVDIAVLIVLATHVLLGVRRGFLVSLLGVAGLVCAVVAGHVWAGAAGDLLRDRFGVDPLIATGLGGALVFFAVSLVFSGVTHAVRRRRRHRDREEGRATLSMISRLGGGALGLAVASVLVLVLLWTYDAVRGGLPGLGLSDVSASRSVSLMRGLVNAGTRQILSGRMGEGQSTALASALSTPGASVGHLAALLEEPVIDALLRDPALREDVLAGDPDRIASNAAFRDVMVDTNVSSRLLDMGLVPDPYDPDEVGAAWAAQIAVLGSRLEEILNDPDVAEALQGLQEDGVIEDADWKALVMDPRTRLIAGQVLAPRDEAAESEIRNSKFEPLEEEPVDE